MTTTVDWYKRCQGTPCTNSEPCPLHAAAPELREALAHLVGTSDNPSAHSVYLRAARALLAKIGETP